MGVLAKLTSSARGWMQSTGQTVTQAVSLVPMHGSAMMKAMVLHSLGCKWRYRMTGRRPASECDAADADAEYVGAAFDVGPIGLARAGGVHLRVERHGIVVGDEIEDVAEAQAIECLEDEWVAKGASNVAEVEFADAVGCDLRLASGDHEKSGVFVCIDAVRSAAIDGNDFAGSKFATDGALVEGDVAANGVDGHWLRSGVLWHSLAGAHG